MDPQRNYRRALFITWVAISVGVLILLSLMVKVLWDSETARKADKVAFEGHIRALELKVGTMEKLLETDQTENNALKSQMEGNVLTLQDVYFENLKKNDGLIPVWTDPRPGRRAYLTFDDGPTENTSLILDALKAQKVRATFFVNGRPELGPLYQREAREGHRIGNHTYSHDYNLVYSSVDSFFKDVERLDAFLATLSLPPSHLYRFPGGAKNEIAARLGGPDLTGRITAALADRGYRFFEWNVAVGDGESKPDSMKYTSDEIRKSILAQVKTKRIAVILLHDGPGHRETALAVPGIIVGLRKMGFSLEVLP